MILIPGLSEMDCREIEEVFRNALHLRQVWLFGSRANGTAKNGSDVDLAVEGFNGNLEHLSELRYQLNQASGLPYSFDVIDRTTINSPELIDHLERVGLLVYQRP